MILEYAVAIGAVAIGWSGYIVNLIKGAGINLPAAIINPPGVNGGFVNLPAILIIGVITCVLIAGVKESTRFNNIIVIVKIAVVLLFIALGAFHIKPQNWHPFIPYGWNGVFKGAAIVFFAYIGFDAVSTAAEEVKNPQKDLPKGIIYSLIICTVLYIIVAAILTGVLPYFKYKETAAPVAYALQQIGINWGSALVSVGAVCGITSVLLVMLFGQTRIFYAMSRDGLLPKVFGEVHTKFGTPVKSTILVGVITSLIAGFTSIGEVAELTNIGTLAAFIIVSASVIVLRIKRPDIERPFKCPLVPILPLISIAFCGYLIIMLPTITKWRFIIWLGLGLIIYFSYSVKHSVMKKE